MGVFTTLSPQQVRDILEGFGLTGYRTHVPIAAGTINTNIRVELDGGPRFLRINEGKSVAEVAREADIVAHVAARGVPTPVPLAARDGRAWLDFGGDLVSLFPWRPGQTLTRSQVGVVHAREAGRALATLHRSGRDFGDRRPGRYEPDEIMRRLVTIEAEKRADLTDAVAVLRPTLDQLAGQRHPDLPLGLIHGDLFIDNVLYDQEGRLTALLDFEQASWGRLAYDLAVTLLAFGYGQDDFREAETRALLDAYQLIRPVDPRETTAFGDELRFAACRFAVTRITDVHLRREAGAPGGKKFERYLQRLRSVESHLARGDGLLTLG